MPGIEFQSGENTQEARANLGALLGDLTQATMKNTRGVEGSDIASILAKMQNGETASERGEIRARIHQLGEIPVDPKFAKTNPEEATENLLRAVGG